MLLFTPSDFGTISFIEDVNNNIFARKMWKGTHIGTRFLLLWWTSEKSWIY